RTRAAGMALSYNISVPIFGGFAPFFAASLIQLTGDKHAPSFYLMLTALISLGTLLAARAQLRPGWVRGDGAEETPRIKKVDFGNVNNAIRHCEEPLRRSNPGAAYCGPWIAHMGILASGVDFSFSCCGFLMWRRRGLDGRRAPSSSWKPIFPAARGCQGAKLAGGDAPGAPLTGPSRRKAYELESEGAAVGGGWGDC